MKRPTTKTPTPPPLRNLPAAPRNGAFLLDHLAETLNLSRRAAKSLLDDRHVFINGRRIWMAKHRLQTRDVIQIIPDAVPASSGPNAPPPPVRILLDDPQFLVADKPARLSTTGDKSLERRLRDQLQNPLLRAVHRLDKDTTGAVLFAKNEAARKALIAQFEGASIQKIYHALVAGTLSEPETTIRKKIENKTAVSHVRQVSAQTRPPRCAHVTVSIETGRTHQIRIHLHGIGNPVLGDRQYFSTRSADFPEVPRHMLHAHILRFAHPDSGKTVTIKSPIPKDFRTWLRALHLD